VIPEDADVHEFWSLESVGIYDPPHEDEDGAAQAAFDRSITKVYGRYAVGWPWKDSQPDLPSNFEMTFSRMSAILKKLQNDHDLLRKYDAIIQEQLEKGIIEGAERAEGQLEHYLPHHPVVTHKLRIVYDASAHTRGGKSLNQCLFRGPIILPDLVGLLLRFRIMKYPLLSDIEKAFLQIELLPADREVTKFLWVKDVTKPPVGDNLVIFRFKRVPFGVISSPFLLAATVRYHLAQYDEPITNEMSENAYVDNIMMGGETLEDILGKYRRSREIMDEASMNLREFVTNAPGFNKSVPMEHRLDTNTPKVLGIPWN
jgi:hypothetical protein